MERTADPRHGSCVRTRRASGRGPLIAIVRAARMKTTDTLVRVTAALIMALWLSGCCTHYVSNIGKSEASLDQKRVFSNDEGDILVEAELVRSPVNNRDSVHSLGIRYAYLTAPDAKLEIADAIGKRHVRHQRGTNYIQLSRGNFNPGSPGRWRFGPEDVLNRIDRPPIPTEIRQPLYEVSGRRWEQATPSLGSLHYNVDGTNYVVEVSVHASGIWFPDAFHQAGWAYPFRILYIPAVAVDVATSPIQFIWLVNQFSKWGDGSGL